VHALLGENGAGKSTLIKVVTGAVNPDEGSVVINGKAFNKLTPRHAKQLGVEVIYQEFNLVDSLSVAENICLGERSGRWVDYRHMERTTSDIFTLMGIHIPMNQTIAELSSSHKQLVEIAKAISKDAKILIMDEPSAALSVAEVAKHRGLPFRFGRRFRRRWYCFCSASRRDFFPRGGLCRLRRLMRYGMSDE
jgi:ribose transport system ATP-binding protein